METSPLLDRYKGIVSASLIEQIYEVAHSLAGLHVLYVNTTAQGGGVAEILNELLPIMGELGIQHDWKVISLDEASGYFTARLVDMLQGYDTGAFPEAEKQVFLEKLRHAVSKGPEYQADVYFIHDFQLVPLAELFPWIRPTPPLQHSSTFGNFWIRMRLRVWSSRLSTTRTGSLLPMGFLPEFLQHNPSEPLQQEQRQVGRT